LVPNGTDSAGSTRTTVVTSADDVRWLVVSAGEGSAEILILGEAALAGLVELGDAAGVESSEESAAGRALEYFFAGFVSAESFAAEFLASAGFVRLALVRLVVLAGCEALVADLFLFVGFLVVEEAAVAEPSVAVPDVDGDPAPGAEGPEADVPPAPDPEPAVEPDDADDDVSDPPPCSVAQTGADATADPTPRAIASAPTRPTYRAYPMKDPPCSVQTLSYRSKL
jgi:hypothetical protein